VFLQTQDILVIEDLKEVFLEQVVKVHKVPKDIMVLKEPIHLRQALQVL